MSITANINPKMLIWARENQGFTQEEVASKPRFTKLLSWESGEKKPTMNQLIDLAQFYHRASAIFFLPEPPQSGTVIPDFRAKSLDDPSPLSPTLQTEIRLCNSKRKRALELAEILNEEAAAIIPSVSLGNDVEQAATVLSKFLDIDYSIVNTFRQDGEVLDYYIDRVGSRNILVFRSHTNTGLNPSYKEIRGISFYEDEFPWILINSQEHPRGQLFSLGHELTHLMLRSSGICDLDESEGADSQALERFCNQVSAALLMPSHQIERIIKDNSISFQTREMTDSAIQRIQELLHISKESIARRLVTLGYIEWTAYRRVRQESIRFLDDERRSTKPIPAGQYYYRRVIKWNGIKFTRLTASAYMDGEISLGQAVEYMRTTIPHFNKIIQEQYY